MKRDFSFSRKKMGLLFFFFLASLLFVYVAGYLSGIMMDAPGPEPKPVVKVLPPALVPIVLPPAVDKMHPEVIAPVVEPAPIETPPEAMRYAVQIGSFRTQARAETKRQQLAQKGYEPYIYHGVNSKGEMWYTVRIADFPELAPAIQSAREYKTRENAAVVLTEYHSLALVKTPKGQPVAIEPLDSAPPLKTPAPKPKPADAAAPAAETDDNDGDAADGSARGAGTPSTDASPGTPASTAAASAPAPQPADAAAPAADTDENDGSGEKRFSLQVGSFKTAARAASKLQRLMAGGYAPYVFYGANSKGALWYTVRIADFSELDEAVRVAREFQRREGSDVVLTHYDSLLLVRDAAGQPLAIGPPPIDAASEEAGGDAVASHGDASQPKAESASHEAVGGYSVQVGAFLKPTNAERLAEKLKEAGFPAYVFRFADAAGKQWHIVRTGDFGDLASAVEAAGVLKAKNGLSSVVTPSDTITPVTSTQ